MGMSDSPELKHEKLEFNLRIAQLKENYGIVVKIYEPKDIPRYAQCNADGVSVTEYIDPDDISTIR
jgi:hypothetical protein